MLAGGRVHGPVLHVNLLQNQELGAREKLPEKMAGGGSEITTTATTKSLPEKF